MKKMTFFLLLVLNVAGLWAQTALENEQKYTHFREQLRNDFIYYTGDARIKGSHLPMEWRKTQNNKEICYWADAIWWQGHYVAFLATEYRLRQLHGQSTDSTLAELKEALETYNRLDRNAELCWNGDTALNGFYLRDDADESLVAAMHVDVISSDYLNNCGKLPTHGNAPSQDQAWGSYLGFALVLKLVDDTIVQQQVTQIASRMIRQMQFTDADGDESWQIINPVNGELIQTKGDIQWMQYAHAEAGKVLTGKRLDFGNSNQTSWKSVWDVLQNNMLITKSGNFRWYGVMVLSTVINEWGSGSANCYDWLIKMSDKIVKKRPDLEQTLIFPHLPLTSIVLYGYPDSYQLNRAAYEGYLNSAPVTGAIHLLSDNITTQSTPPWHSLSLFCPWHTAVFGRFNMLDYMLLYNLFQLVVLEDKGSF